MQAYDARMRRRAALLVLAVTLVLPASASADPERQGLRRIGTVPVKEPGFVRVSREALATLGARHPERVSVTRLGRPVPVATHEPDLVFLAEDHATESSDWGVYELWLHDGAAPTSLPKPGSAPRDDPPVMPSALRLVYADRVHGPLAAGRPEVYDDHLAPTWFVGRIPPGGAWTTDLDPAGAADG